MDDHELPLNVIAISVDGQDYSGWLSVQISRSIGDAASTFSMTASMDRGSIASLVLPALIAGAECQITVDGEPVLTGQIDRRSASCSADNYLLSIQGRSNTRNVVDSSAVHPTGQFNKQRADQIIQAIAGELDVGVKVDKQADKILERYILRDSEKAIAAIAGLANEYGLTYTDTPEGELRLLEPGDEQGAGDIILGVNLLSYVANTDVSERHSKVTVKGSSVPTDENYGKSAQDVRGAAEDDGVRQKRPLIVPAYGDIDAKTARERAILEQNRRSGKGTNVNGRLAGWRNNGALWDVGFVHNVVIPTEGIATAMLIENLTFSADENTGPVTDVSLVLPNTYKKTAGSGGGGGGAGSSSGGGGGAGGSAPSTSSYGGGNTPSLFKVSTIREATP